MFSFAASSDWLWNVLPWAAGIAFSTKQKAWTFYQSHRGESWPISYGGVLITQVET